jgi:SAM-dependent methyltransferase
MRIKETVMDHTGFEILKVISKAGQFNKWMYTVISPYLHGHILEIGSGIGNISSQFIKSGSTISLSDIDPFYLNLLKENYSSAPNVKIIECIDLQHPEFEIAYNHLEQKFDSIFLLNVLEHLENETSAINNCSFLLKPKGTLLILVPAYSFLFSRLDSALGHYRRYTQETLCRLLEIKNLQLKKSFYFNAFGILGWLYSKLLRLKKIPSGEMGLFDKLVPFIKWIDSFFHKRIGLSVVAVASKPENATP